MNATITQHKYKRTPMDVRISNFVDASIELGYGGRDYLTRQETKLISNNSGLPYPRWLAKNIDRRLERGKFSFPELAEANTSTTVVESVAPGHGTDGDDLSDMVTIDDTNVSDDTNSLIATSDDMTMLASDDALVMTDEDKIALGIM